MKKKKETNVSRQGQEHNMATTAGATATLTSSSGSCLRRQRRRRRRFPFHASDTITRE
jgi:hypothetical protein